MFTQKLHLLLFAPIKMKTSKYSSILQLLLLFLFISLANRYSLDTLLCYFLILFINYLQHIKAYYSIQKYQYQPHFLHFRILND